jgi:hypothetical protein
MKVGSNGCIRELLIGGVRREFVCGAFGMMWG